MAKHTRGPDRRRFLARTDQWDRASVAQMSEPKVDGTVATLRLYDVIDSWGGYWGVSAAEFVEALDALGDDITEIQLHINSPGGEVWQGLTIMNALRQHKAHVVVTVDAIAASAASFIAMAGDEIVMALGAEMMIHDAMNICAGNAQRMLDMAERLDRESNNIAGIYASKAGGTTEQWREAMKAETWYSAEEAVAAGLADRLDDDQAAEDEAKNLFDLSFFAYAGRAKAPAPKTPTATSAAGKPTKNREKLMELTDEQAAGLRTRLGIADENADAETILAALDEALAEQNDDKDGAPAKDTGTPKAVTLPEGVVAVEQSVLDALRTDASAGAEARKKQQADERTALVNAAVKDGRIAPARAQAWVARLEADPGEAETLAKLERGLVPTAELGHAGDGEDENTLTAVLETPAYKNWSSE